MMDKDKKIKKFKLELATLLDKYQYGLKAFITVTENGIMPSLKIVEASSQKQNK